MTRIIHLADVHLGSVRDRFLRSAEERALRQVVEVAERESPDVLVIAGDLFDSNIPPISRVTLAADFLRRLKDLGVEVCMIYGSHDFSPTRSTMVEVLSKAGLIRVIEGPMKLKGVYLDGVPGLMGALEVRNFPSKSPPPKDTPSLFVFHTAIAEAVRGRLFMPEEQMMPASKLPKGFSYYAGGHVHKRIEWKFEGRPLAYPGPLFIGYGLDDLQEYLKGEDRGFYIVDLEPFTLRYERVRPVEGRYVELDVTGLTPVEVRKALEDGLKGIRPGWAVLAKLKGSVKGRRVDAIAKIERLRSSLEREGVHLYVNDRGMADESMPKEPPRATVEKMLDELAGKYPGRADRDFIKKLIDALGQEKGQGEKEREYMKRIRDEVLKMVEGNVRS